MSRSTHIFAAVLGATLLCGAGAVSASANSNADDKAIQSNIAEVDGVQLHYLTAGQGPAVVILLHGYAETSRMWRPILPQLATRFRVIAPDLRFRNSHRGTGYEERRQHHSCAGAQTRR